MNNKINDLSYLKLKWNIQGIFDDFSILQSELEKQKVMLPENNLKDRRKIANWIEQINKIDENIKKIKQLKLIELEQNLNYRFAEHDLVVLSFIQPSIKNLFNELSLFSSKVGLEYNFEQYLNMDEAAKVLALIGDAVIDLALVQILWQPNISKVGELSQKRSDFASNENLARICDKWNLYDSRIHLDPNHLNVKDETINHVKGTIVEALFGVMYIESGLDKIITSIGVLK